MTNVIKSNSSTRIVNSKIISYGGDLDTSKFRYNQSPVETPNDVTTVFTLPNSDTYVSGLLEVFLDGIKQTITTDYTETTQSTFTMVTAPATGEVMIINYIKP